MEYFRIGIVVVSYHNPRMTSRFVREELPKLSTPYELVIVNNDSTQTECDYLARECGISKSSIVCSKENLGYARGNNLGVEYLNQRGAYTHYLFCNDDIEIKDSNVLEVLCRAMSTKTDVACIGPKIIGLEGADQSPHDNYISPYRQIGWRVFRFFRKKNRDSSRFQSYKYTKSHYTYWISGAFMLVSARDFGKVNGFDNRTFLYFEEAILAERFRKIGKKVFYEPSVCVLHYEGNSTKQETSSFKKKIEKESRMLYYREYKGVGRFLLFFYNIICK